MLQALEQLFELGPTMGDHGLYHRRHYFFANLPQQFDAVIHFDETRAVEPLERTSEWEGGELPESYPSGL